MVFNSRPHWSFFIIPIVLFLFGCWASFTVYEMFVSGLISSDPGSMDKRALSNAGALITATSAIMVFAAPFLASLATKRIVYLLTAFLLFFEVGTMVITQYSLNQYHLNKEQAAIIRAADLERQIAGKESLAAMYKEQNKLAKADLVGSEANRLSAELKTVKESTAVSNNGILQDSKQIIAFYTIRAFLISIIGLIMFHLTGSVTNVLSSERCRFDEEQEEKLRKEEEERVRQIDARRRQWDRERLSSLANQAPVEVDPTKVTPVNVTAPAVVIDPTLVKPSGTEVSGVAEKMGSPTLLPSVVKTADSTAEHCVKDIFEDLFSNQDAPLPAIPTQPGLPGIKRRPGRPEKPRAHYSYYEIKEGILKGRYVPSIAKIEAATGMKRLQIKQYLSQLVNEGVLFQVGDRFYLKTTQL